MAKTVKSWSQPDKMIGRKQIDWSMFEYGTHIPLEFREDFAVANGGLMPVRGETRGIQLLIEGKAYEATFYNHNKSDRDIDFLEIRYDGNPELRKLLRERFQASYEHLSAERRAKAAGEGKKVYAHVPDHKAEYMEFYETGTPFRYRVELVTAKQGNKTWPPDFEQVWSDLGRRFAVAKTVYTLSQKSPNQVRWLGDNGMEVKTDQGENILLRGLFESAWQALCQAGRLSADDFPGQARYRSTAISTILTELPYVGHTTKPKMTLFLQEAAAAREPAAWIFQANPKTYDVTGAVAQLSELTWLVRQYQKEIKAGDRVFLWEAGADAGVIAVATVLTDPATLPQRSEEAAYYLAEDTFEGDQLRAGLHVDQVLPQRVLRRDLQQHPILSTLSILRQAAGTNFPVTPAQAVALLDLIDTPPPARLDLAAICSEFSIALKQSHIDYGPGHTDLVRSFVTALATKRFAILTGMSGSGKTQLALRLGDWLGEGRCSVIPVRPDWTGAEALFGYEDALQPAVDGCRVWHVPEALAFMHTAAADRHHPYLLILDEMNLAHVERYFADVLSGMESGQPVLRNLRREADGWRTASPDPEDKMPIPSNLFIVGTVNVDETTYMFSPKVLDRANTFELRVRTEDLAPDSRKPEPCPPGDPMLARGLLVIARDEAFHREHAATYGAAFADHFRTLHALLAEGDFEFGHRVYYEAMRFAALLAVAGNESVTHALDLQIMQKVLPRLHGNRRRLEPTLCALAQFCYDLTFQPGTAEARGFDPLRLEYTKTQLPLSFEKARRMTRALRVNQFASFTE